ncbi:MAG: PAS domain-containing protein [bacterium]
MSAEKTDEQVKFRQIFESSRDAIMLIGPEGYIDCNEATLELFDVETKEDFKQLSPWKLSPSTQPDGSNSIEAAREHINRALAEGTDFFEWTHKRKDGETFFSEVKLSSFELEGQEIVQALVRDITERKQREEELKATEQQLRAEVEDRRQAQAELKQRTGELQAVINAMPDACFVLDREGNYCQVMTNQEELLAAPPRGVVG